VIDTASRFEDRFRCAPQLVVSAPGRVNIVGEHTDYSGFPVLPMAIQRRVVLLAAAADDDRVLAASEQLDGTYDSAAEPTAPWTRYVAAAIVAVGQAGGARLLVAGDLPPTGGLSSSSAVTVATVTALLSVWNLDGDRDRIVELALAAERSTGVEGGAMDQTIIVHARRGNALRIDFSPPARRQVEVPDTICFVAGYCGSPAAKGGDAMEEYNRRVVGCRLAAVSLAALSGVDPATVRTLADVRDRAGGVDELPESASARQVAVGARIASDLDRLTSGRIDADVELPLRAMARHVFSESRRVDHAEEALRSGDLVRIGEILDESHRSLSDDFGVSTPSLDALVSAGRDAGASGARLTGAGFGGWAIAACSPAATARVADAMRSIAGSAFVATASEGLRWD
jgi:N-acetylgalactosamine kinase